MNENEVLIRTYSGEKLKGYLVEPREQLFKDTGLDNLVNLGVKFDGVWLLRMNDQKISYIGNDEISSIKYLKH